MKFRHYPPPTTYYLLPTTYYLVSDLVRFPLPLPEAGQRFLSQQLLGGQGAPANGQAHLLVDQAIVEADGGGILARRPKINPLGARPVNRGQAHGAGLGRAVDFAAAKLEILERGAGAANGDDFR